MTFPLPAFGDVVAKTLNRPDELVRFSGCTAQRGTVWILTGEDAANQYRAMPNHLTVILPAGANPVYFSWRFLVGHEPALVWCDATDFGLVDAVWKALERDGLRSAIFGNGEWPSQYRERSHAA